MGESLTYFLPLSQVSMGGVVEHVTESFDPGRPVTREIPMTTAVSWSTVGDRARTHAVSLDGGFLEERLTTLTLTSDRRLGSVGMQSKSQAGEFIKATTKAAVLLASAGAFLSDRATARAPSGHVAYDEQEPEASEHLAELRDQLAQARQLVATRRSSLLETAASTPIPSSAFREIDSLVTLIQQVESEVDDATATRQAWIDARTTRRTEQLHAVLDTRNLPRWRGGNLDWAPVATTESTEVLDAHDVWCRLGFVVASAMDPPENPRVERAAKNGVFVRIPRLHWFVLLRKQPGLPADDGSSGSEPPVVEQYISRWLLDDSCDVEFIQLGRSWFGDKNVSMGFDADGALTSLGKGGKSGVTEVVSGAVDGLGEGLTSATSAMDAVDSLRGHDRALKAARIAQDLAIAKNQVELDGLGATTSEQLEAQRLKQLSELAT